MTTSTGVQGGEKGVPQTAKERAWEFVSVGFRSFELSDERLRVYAAIIEELIQGAVDDALAATPATPVSPASQEPAKVAPVGWKEFANELRKWWSFDEIQRPTHSWHDREDFIELKLPKLLASAPSPAPDSAGEGEEIVWALYKNGVFQGAYASKWLAEKAALTEHGGGLIARAVLRALAAGGK